LATRKKYEEVAGTIRLAGYVFDETANAWLFGSMPHRRGAKWLPKSQARMIPAGQAWFCVLPEWLAKKKGLLSIPRLPRKSRDRR
jgi:hypothetical protein